MARIVFFDLESKPIDKELSAADQRWHLRDIEKDIHYFGKSYRHADLQLDIAGLDVLHAACRVKEALAALQKPKEPPAA
ncbi:hypothetical protein [Candidatus Accumulibacter sp. ACC003]|uniref:hypothetical protein n=1 Tax=Candidatus Accumulibacter sp. ACC003 TaxID=2823334 RepID=UPI0025C53B71|nr:hypothetical protein [Candidatus Accumulibacter sp. ACC003]